MYICVFQHKFCPLASDESFGDISIIFSEQFGIVALRRCLVFGENPSKNVDAVCFLFVLDAGYRMPYIGVSVGAESSDLTGTFDLQ